MLDAIRKANTPPLRPDRLARMASVDDSWWQDIDRQAARQRRRALPFPWRSVIGWAWTVIFALAVGYFGGMLITWLLLDEQRLMWLGIGP